MACARPSHLGTQGEGVVFGYRKQVTRPVISEWTAKLLLATAWTIGSMQALFGIMHKRARTFGTLSDKQISWYWLALSGLPKGRN
jgi:hypothetical protein